MFSLCSIKSPLYLIKSPLKSIARVNISSYRIGKWISTPGLADLFLDEAIQHWHVGHVSWGGHLPVMGQWFPVKKRYIYHIYIYIIYIYISYTYIYIYMGISWNGGTPKSSILMGCSIINHPAIRVKCPYIQRCSLGKKKMCLTA